MKNLHIESLIQAVNSNIAKFEVGAVEVLHAYNFTKENYPGNDEVIFERGINESHLDDSIQVLQDANVDKVIFMDDSTKLMNMLTKFIDAGFKVEETVEIEIGDYAIPKKGLLLIKKWNAWAIVIKLQLPILIKKQLHYVNIHVIINVMKHDQYIWNNHVTSLKLIKKH